MAARLEDETDCPFFMACGFYHPHQPWYAPRPYFDLYPLESIRLPRTLEDDLADVPAQGRSIAIAGGEHVINANEVDPVEAVLELTHGERVDVAIEAIGGTGIGIVQGLGMLRHNGILALYGDNYAPVKELCFHRFHEDGIEVRNLNAVHYTRLRSVEHMRV